MMRSIADLEKARTAAARRARVSRALNWIIPRWAVAMMCRKLDGAAAACESLPGDRRRALAVGADRIAARLAVLAPALRNYTDRARRSLRLLYSDACDVRAALSRSGRFREADIVGVVSLLERNGELAHRELRAWFDRLEWRRGSDGRFYGVLCAMEAAGFVTGHYIAGNDGRDRAFALPQGAVGDGRRA